MKTLAEYLELAAAAHGHLCAGQVLGVRLAMLGLRELGIDDPVAERKRLVTYVEIDRCVTDAVALVANCRLGKRALKFRDWQSRRHFRGPPDRPRRARGRQGIFQASRPRNVSRTRHRSRPAKSLRAALRRYSLRQTMGDGASPT